MVNHAPPARIEGIRRSFSLTEMVVGPLWSAKGLDIAAGRYPLRVETYVSQMVDRLLPGVTTVTTQARYFLLHPLVWAEASRRSLDLEAARQLLRRCEVVIAAVSALHEPHDGLPTAHGADLVGTSLSETGVLRVADLQAIGRYSAQVAGFAGTIEDPRRGLAFSHPQTAGSTSQAADLNRRRPKKAWTDCSNWQTRMRSAWPISSRRLTSVSAKQQPDPRAGPSGACSAHPIPMPTTASWTKRGR